MKQTRHSQEFKEQALRKLRERGDQTQQSVADELNISLAMLKGWLRANVIAAWWRGYAAALKSEKSSSIKIAVITGKNISVEKFNSISSPKFILES